jgi:ABC-type dipeptide/oligopeptide/nickel transport system permease component
VTGEHITAFDAAHGEGGAGSARRWRPGVTTGVLAAAPSTAAATGSALLAACGSCLGAGSLVAVSAAGGAAAGATTGAAASAGMPLWQLVFTAVVFAVLAALQLRRALAAARVRGGSGGRGGFVVRQMAPSLLTAAVAFAAVQLVIVPWLSAPPAPAGPTLP